MMTQNSSCSRIVAVWLVLLAFLCGMIVPSLALAKQDMTIGSEGDPTDGLDYTGGGGGGGGILDGGDGEEPQLSPRLRDQEYSWDLLVHIDLIFLTRWENGRIQLVFIFDGFDGIPAGANK